MARVLLGDVAIADLAVLSSGVVVVSATSGTDLAVARINADASLDVHFGSDGMVSTLLGDGARAGLDRRLPQLEHRPAILVPAQHLVEHPARMGSVRPSGRTR